MITAEALQHIRSKFRGDLITRDDPRFDAARKVFNAMIDRRPGLIARCTSPEDVAHIIKLAHDRGEVLSVRCAGHNVAGYAVCDEGVVIDLSPMKQIDVDPVERSVRVEAGATWGEVNDALQGHGLAATGGFVSVTGVSGLTLGGGFGWLMRKHGLALDNLISAQVVLADGEHVTASAAENPDLFWAIRGGGGNFGVVTSFQFRVHPAGTVFAGIVLHPASGATDVLRHWREFEKTSPNDLTQGALLFHFPDDPSAPPALRASPVIGVGGVCAGPPGDGERPVEVKPGTHSGTTVRLKGLGVGKLQRAGRGDLFVHLDVLTPTDLTAEQEELLRQLASQRGEEMPEAALTPVGHGVFARLRDAFMGR